MRINDYNTIFVFFKSLKRWTGIMCARQQHLSLLSFGRFTAEECSYHVFIFHETFVPVNGENYSRR